MSLGDLIRICQTPGAIFTLEEANEILPLIKKITDKSSALVDQYLHDQNWYMKSGAPEKKIKELDAKVQDELKKWAGKIGRLGLTVIGSNIVLFNNSVGWWSWFYGEDTVCHFHGYNETIQQRRRVGLLAFPATK